MAQISPIRGNKKVINAWAFYDWANSVYNLVITATIFPIYYNSVTPGKINFFGVEMKNTTLYDFSISFGYLVIVILAPFLSGIADYGGYKKRFMQAFCYMGAIACSCLYFFTEETIGLGILFAIIACIGYSGSLVFYNAFLPEIAHPQDQDRISAKGFSMGYIGSSILLILNLVIVLKPQAFGFNDTGAATRFAFLTVGIWWLLFAQISFYYLPNNVFGHRPEGNALTKGFLELKKVWRELKQTQRLKRFLLAFFVFSMGVQTVMLVASHFGSNEIISGYESKIDLPRNSTIDKWLVEDHSEVEDNQPLALINNPSANTPDTIYSVSAGTFTYSEETGSTAPSITILSGIETKSSVPVKMDAGQLILTILIIQFVAIAGAYLFSFLSGRLGNIATLRIATLIWALICISTYLFVYTTTHFFIIAALVGLVMGGIQSLSRSTYSKLLPETEDHASFFSFYDICEKLSIVFGMALFGIINELSASMREPIIILIIFFAVGYILLWRVKAGSADEIRTSAGNNS